MALFGMLPLGPLRMANTKLIISTNPSLEGTKTSKLAVAQPRPPLPAAHLRPPRLARAA